MVHKHYCFIDEKEVEIAKEEEEKEEDMVKEEVEEVETRRR